NALREKGWNKEASETEQFLRKENEEALHSFDNTFDFCPVYFFYAKNAGEIAGGNLVGYVFDSKLQKVPEEKLQARPFYTAEFGKTEKLDMSAFVLANRQMEPLQAPFPFFERTYTFLSLIKRSKARIVEAYNEKLHSYYERWI